MRQYRMNYRNDEPYVEYRNDETGNWYSCAGFDKESRLIFYGDLPDEMCEEIYAFLESQCIHIDESAQAWVLTN